MPSERGDDCRIYRTPYSIPSVSRMLARTPVMHRMYGTYPTR